MRFAVDTGGTFTALLVEDDDGLLHMYKAPTTPADPIAGVLAAFELAAADRGGDARSLLARGDLFIHGTTIATNAILTGRTAKTAFLTTAGHPDILVFREAGRMGLPMFDYGVPYPEPYVPRALTFEVPERIGADGRVLRPLDDGAVLALVPALAAEGVEAVGVCLLWSIVNPRHERRIGELLARHLPGVAVSLSHAVNPSVREYRRASATCIDASLKPLMGEYLEGMSARLRAAGFAGAVMVVTSQGGVMEAGDIARAPIHAVKSGPAMAPVAGRAYAMAEGGADTAIVADAGGTSYDVSLVRRMRIPWTRETWIGPPYRGHMTGFPSVDVRIVGAGGGAVGLNAVALARRLGCPRVIIPDVAAALSAAGALLSDLAAEFSRLHLTTASQFDRAGVDLVLADLKERCRRFAAGPGARAHATAIDFSVEARYARQIWEIEVPLRGSRVAGPADLDRVSADVHATHREIFAIDDPGSEIEFVTWRARARCTLRAAEVGPLADSAPAMGGAARPAHFERLGRVPAAVVSLAAMAPGVPHAGPLIVESPVTTVVVDPGAVARRTPRGSLVITP